MSHTAYDLDWEDRDKPFPLSPERTVEENTKFIDWREMYLQEGYSFREATQRAWDLLWAERKAKPELYR
jgi:hypothetical protein